MPQNQVQATDIDYETFVKLTNVHTDVTGAAFVQVQVDRRRKVLHVNVNGVCVFRACQIQTLEVEELG